MRVENVAYVCMHFCDQVYILWICPVLPENVLYVDVDCDLDTYSQEFFLGSCDVTWLELNPEVKYVEALTGFVILILTTLFEPVEALDMVL